MTTIAFNNLTCLDHSVISNTGDILGGSYIFSVIILVDSDSLTENFVELQKYKIVTAISKLDNKLWVCADSKTSKYAIGDTTLTTPKLQLQMPENYFLVVDCKYEVAALEKKFSKYLEAELCNYGKKLKVICKLCAEPLASNDYNGLVAFRYSRGLPKSNNQYYHNIAGGTLAYFVLLDSDYQPLSLSAFEDFSDKLTELSFEFDSTYFVNSNCCVPSTGASKIEYSTSEGYFSLLLNSKVVQLQNEATDKNICEYMAKKFSDFTKVGAKYLMLTEGMSTSYLTEI